MKNVFLELPLTEYRYERDLTDNYDKSTLDIKNYSHNILVGIKLN